MDMVMPLSNDDFVNAAPLSAVPVSVSVDLTTATIEPGEPDAAGIRTSAWYAYTPETTGTLVLRSGFDFGAVLAVYTGSSLADLTQVARVTGPTPLIFPAQAATTYYVQVAKALSVPSFSSVVNFTIEQPGPPVAGFGVSPSAPSIYDDIQFVDTSFDPASIGLGSAQWDFGDGTVAANCCPIHRYAADGDYTVTMLATTFDGRTATAMQTISVRTHDVSIERIQEPNSARVGQAKDVRVNVRGGRYPETVQVDLYKSVAGGFDQLVATRTQAVPVAHGGRTTGFDFRYTFTAEDGAAGKVTFRAVATLVGARDALPADNQAIAPPTAVKG
jgi:PKD repeat protein